MTLALPYRNHEYSVKMFAALLSIDLKTDARTDAAVQVVISGHSILT